MYHHHHVTLLARISLTFSCHHRSREVFLATSCVGTVLLYIGSSSSSYLYSSMWRGPQEYIAYEFILTSPAVSVCLVRLTLIVFVMGGRWPYSCCFVGCCLQDLFNTARSILVYLPSSFFSIVFVSVHEVHPFDSIDTIAAWKKLRSPTSLPLLSDPLWPGVVAPEMG